MQGDMGHPGYFLLCSKWLPILVSLLPLDLWSRLYLEVEGDLVSGDLLPGWLREIPGGGSRADSQAAVQISEL